MHRRQTKCTDNKDLLDKIKYRAKFEVSIAEWNPRMDIIAIGSQNGDVMVKRYLWKTGWRRNFSKEQPSIQFGAFYSDAEQEQSSSSSTTKDKLLFLCWSPDGQILLCVFQSGRCYYLDTQTGNVLYFKKLPNSPTSIEWLKSETKIASKCDRIGELPLTLITSFDLISNEGAPKDNWNVCADVEHFYRNIVHKSLSASFLCVTYSGSDGSFLDIFADGILLIKRFGLEQLSSSTEEFSFQTMQKKICLADGRFYVSIKDGQNLSGVLQFPGKMTQQRLFIYNQIVDCICWMSFCFVYFQWLFSHVTKNWQQSSEAFHQRIFAAANNSHLANPNSSLNIQNILKICNYLACALDGNEEAEKMVEEFLSSSITEKELKQASSFLDEFTILANGFACGLQLTTRTLRSSICLLRSFLTKLCETQIDEECTQKADRLLSTLLSIASNRRTFFPTETLSEKCNRFLLDFENSVILLEAKLQKVLELVEQNRMELQNLLHCFRALIFGSSWDDFSREGIDAKLLIKFLREVQSQEGFHRDGNCMLDRVISHLNEENGESKDEAAFLDVLNRSLSDLPLHSLLLPHLTASNHNGQPKPTVSTIWDNFHLCLRYFRLLNVDGITSLVPSSIENEKCVFFSEDEWTNELKRCKEDCWKDEEEIDEKGRMSDDEESAEEENGGRGPRHRPMDLHSFVFGYPDPLADEFCIQ